MTIEQERGAAESAPIQMASVRLHEDDIAAAVEVLRSGQIRQGSRCRQFEEAFAEYVGAAQAVFVSSGTAALHLAWLALIEPGDEVIVPSFTFIATASSVAFAGGRPVFCDVDPNSATMDPADARRCLTGRTRALAPVHLYGNAADVDALQSLAVEHGLTIVWDAAQAHGTRWRGADVGGLNDLVCYSFYPTKNMTTGEGGMLTTNDPVLAGRLRLLRSHGQSGKYFHTMLGLNYRGTDVQAAIGLGQLHRLDENLARRRQNAALLDRGLAGLAGLTTPRVRAGVEHSYHLYTVEIDPEHAGITRDELHGVLAEQGIESAVHYPRPLHRQPALEAFAPTADLPISDRLSETVLSLPVHPLIGAPEVERIVDAVRAAFRHAEP